MRNRMAICACMLSLVLFISPHVPAQAGCGPGFAADLQCYDLFIKYSKIMTGDLLKIVPRAMGQFIYQNRDDFIRGMTQSLRDVEQNPLKQKDFEEIRREAYARLMRDIPYCLEVFKGGDLKMDTSPANLSSRLGMIAYNIAILKLPTFPDVTYQDKVSGNLAQAIVDDHIDLWLYYDGYGEFNSLGELMERLRPAGMPTFRFVRNDLYTVKMREDVFSMFRPPNKFDRNMLVTTLDFNEMYSTIVNCVADTYMYIWKCSGMDLEHPSYSAPPGTVISRRSRRLISVSEAERRAIAPPVTEEQIPERGQAVAPPQGGLGASPYTSPGAPPGSMFEPGPRQPSGPVPPFTPSPMPPPMELQ
ncbi:MAG: hypothetical protein HY914_21785 [Desulfomonile tiedjei]|nr:hypothetical protein [Desulfomonile tiedjei]